MLCGCSHSHYQDKGLYRLIPEQYGEISPEQLDEYLLWALFGNDDDGVYGEKSDDFCSCCAWQQAIHWQLRNPLHNFCFYVIGSADQHNDELDILKISGKGICLFHYHSMATTVFADEQSSFYLGLHGNKPFVSLRLHYLPTRQLDFYLGWRERGNFGLKFNPFKRNTCLDHN